MSGPNVVDTAKMVFHYVAKIAPRTPNSPDVTDANSSREMKVCFRHSKHSIKCDVNAACLECDSGLKLYSYDQCRRHLDVVRSEKRFESIEVDRSENMIEKLCDIDENGRKVVSLLEALLNKQDLVLKSLNERTPDDEAINCSLKEISRNTLKSQKRVDDICERLAQSHAVLTELLTSGQTIATNQTSVNEKTVEMNVCLNTISAQLNAESRDVKEWRTLCDATAADWRTHKTALELEARQTRETMARMEGSVDRLVSSIREDCSAALEAMRRQLVECEQSFRTEVTSAIAGIREEIRNLENSSQILASELKDSLPEKLMDVFGGILMLSADNNRRMDETLDGRESSLQKNEF
ncbi:uncharacterized protein LOC128965987 [Oppia nitens]|uniref:uncharacterized protein LOC128965987 n=1 Tax=Oppia nitens TaxID=1686743 RepID=UPI0023DC85E1|nr:uncharacterized protein LOC128965987 [Oppia nitens]